MHNTLTKFFWLLPAIPAISAIVCGFLSCRESVSLRKGRLRLAAVCLFGSFLSLIGIGNFLSIHTLPILSAEGMIQATNVHAEGRGHRTDFTVINSSGSTYHLNADGASNFFHNGEHVMLTYRGYSGSVIKVHFIGASGTEEGIFQSTEDWSGPVSILLGLLLCGIGYKVFRRDPEGWEMDR